MSLFVHFYGYSFLPMSQTESSSINVVVVVVNEKAENIGITFSTSGCAQDRL